MRNPLLIGERLYLRALEQSDADQFARDAAQDPEHFFTSRRQPLSPIGKKRWIGKLAENLPPVVIQLAICLHDTDRCIGTVELWQIDYVNRTAETGSWIWAHQYRSQGYGPEAKHLLLEYAFDHLQLHVLRSYVWEPNWRSAAAVRHQGYREAGRLMSLATKDWRPRPQLVFDVKREEWLIAREEWRAKQAARRETAGTRPA